MAKKATRKRTAPAEVLPVSAAPVNAQPANETTPADDAIVPVEWFVYLLRCRDGSLYTGITKDVTRRCKQHSAGTASRYTRSRLPVKLVYAETQSSHRLALQRELGIKSLSRQAKECLIRQAKQSA